MARLRSADALWGYEGLQGIMGSQGQSLVDVVCFPSTGLYRDIQSLHTANVPVCRTYNRHIYNELAYSSRMECGRHTCVA
jgi:hypothetical protein